MRKHTPTIDEAALRQALPDEGRIFVKPSRAPGHRLGQPAALEETLAANPFSVGDSAEDARLWQATGHTMCPAVAKPREWQT